MLVAETYLELLKDPAHLMYEITLMVVFDVILAGLAWPLLKKAVRNHDRRHHGIEQ